MIPDRVSMSTPHLPPAAPAAPRPPAPSPPPVPRDSVQIAGPSDAPPPTVTKTFVYDADGHPLKNLVLEGSWNNTGHYTTQWKDSAVRMKRGPDGLWRASVTLTDDGDHPWQWGVQADGPRGKQQWAIFQEDNLDFGLHDGKPIEYYAPSRETRMGAIRRGDDAAFKFWAPDARDVRVKIWDPASSDGAAQDPPKTAADVPLAKDPATGMWSGTLPGGWKQHDGQAYAYQVTTSEGGTVLRTDPYARYREGQQRGIARFYLSAGSGGEVSEFFVDPALQAQGKPSVVPYVRFEVQDHADASDVRLVLRDESGKILDRAALQQRLGGDDGALIRKYHAQTPAGSEPEPGMDDFYADNIDADGRIHLVKQGGAWASVVNDPDKLVGLRYTFEVVDKSGQLVGDADHDGVLSAEEARGTAFNESYDNVIGGKYGWERYGLLREPSFVWRNDNVPRMASGKNQWVIYQLHVGSFMGAARDVRRSTFKDVISQLGYLKDLGVNTLEMLPINSQESSRDWGYVGTNTLAVTDQYGFEDENGKWVCGTDAVKRLVDAAHGMGFNVLDDVVFNHWGPDYNDLYNLDGKMNPYYNWSTDPSATEPVLKPNQFGPLPAYNKGPVRHFIEDAAESRLDDLHLDGLRFDFTHPIHDDSGGGLAGWTMLREINRELHFFHPDALVNAEEFPNAQIMTEPVQNRLEGGAGFDTMWDTEFNHRLVHSAGYPSILQQAAAGQRTDMDDFMGDLIGHPGFTAPMNQVTVITDHDEVGNADRTINVAMNGDDHDLPDAWDRDAVRSTFGIGMLSPGIPLFFQGEESLARNHFTWGVPATWDLGWSWRDAGPSWDWRNVDFGEVLRRLQSAAPVGVVDSPPSAVVALPGPATAAEVAPAPPPPPPVTHPLAPRDLTAADERVLGDLSALPADQRGRAVYDVMRKLHFDFCKDAIALRRSSPAFDGDAAVSRVYTHDDNSVMAFTRAKGGDEYLVVNSLNHNHFSDYKFPIEDGQWQLVLNSNAQRYGGDGFGDEKPRVQGGAEASFDLPAGGLLVYKKVG